MLFNSLQFAVFFPVVVALYHVLPRNLRTILLLVASYVFYMAWEPWYLTLILLSTLTDYFVGMAITSTQSARWRTCWLVTSITVNLGLLFAFKYFNFFAQAAGELAAMLGMGYAAPSLEVLLPVGISFYTFQTLSYTIEVWRGRQDAERDIMTFALYVAFFPQLVAGPIERPGNLIRQIRQPAAVTPPRVHDGLILMLWGMFKKVVIADRLGIFVDAVFEKPDVYGGPVLCLGVVAFAFQIYADFSGYSDIAIGAAKLFGIDLMKNFDRPYFVTSLRSFWRRWHISLSTWFRDYVYLPLGGRHFDARRWAVNIVIVFVLSGLWHGAEWTFIVWGALHGIGYLLESAVTVHSDSDRPQRRIGSIARGAGIFVFVCFAWIFFRAENMGTALSYIAAMTHGWPEMISLDYWRIAAVRSDMSKAAIFVTGITAGVFVLIDGLSGPAGVVDWIKYKALPVRWTWYVATAWAVLNLGVIQQRQFIYFQF